MRDSLSDHELKEMILTNCSVDLKNSAMVVAETMRDLHGMQIVVGDLYLEKILRDLIQKGVIRSDSETLVYGFYSVKLVGI